MGKLRVPDSVGAIVRRRRRRLTAWLAGPLALALAVTAAHASGEPLRVAAASNLTQVLPALLSQYRGSAGAGEAAGREILLTFGASGNLSRQIVQGAPFDLFLSADQWFVDWLAERDETVAVADYARGELVLYVPDRSPLAAGQGLAAVDAALADGRLRRLALANPQHAPYGQAARAALQARGLWQPLERDGLLVYGENVAQTAQFCAGGAVDAGLIPLALALSPALAGKGHYTPVDPALYPPLIQRMALLRRAAGDADARALYAFLLAPATDGIWRRFGFARP